MMKRKLISMLVVIAMVATSVVGIAGCTDNSVGDLGAGSVFTSDALDGANRAEATAEATATATATLEATAEVTAEATASITPQPKTEDDDSNIEDMFCGWFITFNRLKTGKKYIAYGNAEDLSGGFDFGPNVEGIKLFATLAEKKMKPVVSSDCIDSASCKTVAKESGVKIVLKGTAYIKSGVKLFANNVFQKPDGSVYLVGSEKAVTARKKLTASATTVFKSALSGGKVTNHTVNLTIAVKNSSYSKLVFEQYGKGGRKLDVTEVTMYEFPECIELSPKTKKITVRKYNSTPSGEYRQIGVKRYRRKKIGNEYSTWFMGDNPFAVQQILEIIK